MRFVDKDGVHYEIKCDVSNVCDNKGCHKFYSFEDGTKILVLTNKDKKSLFDYVTKKGRRLDGSEI